MAITLKSLLAFRNQSNGGGGGGSGGGSITGPGSSTSGDLVSWSNASGTAIADSGITASSVSSLLSWQTSYGTLAATGATQGTAATLVNRVTNVTSGNGNGVILPAGRPSGEEWVVFNTSAANPGGGVTNTINVYPSSGGLVLPNAVNIRTVLCANNAARFISVGSNTWLVQFFDLKSDHISRTIGDSCYFYGTLNAVNGIDISNGTFACSSASTFSSSIALNSTISPTALGAGPTHNYDPTGLSTAANIRQDMSAAGVVTGLAAQASGRRIRLFNISSTGANTLTLNHEDTNSTAANRFVLPNNSNLTIPCNSGVDLHYDATSSRWRIASGI